MKFESTYTQHARCAYCGVTHLGPDGLPIICPLFRPGYGAPVSTQPVSPTVIVAHCPGCRCFEGNAE